MQQNNSQSGSPVHYGDIQESQDAQFEALQTDLTLVSNDHALPGSEEEDNFPPRVMAVPMDDSELEEEEMMDLAIGKNIPDPYYDLFKEARFDLGAFARLLISREN